MAAGSPAPFASGNIAAPTSADEAASSEAGLPLRLAQRAFAVLLEESAIDGPANLTAFRAAQLRSAARRTLSGLSADDHVRLQRWIGLQLATLNTPDAGVPRNLSRVDAALAATVASALARTHEELFARRAPAGAAAA